MLTRQQANQIAENFWWRKGVARITEFRWSMRAKGIAKQFALFIPENSKVLDIGGGTGSIAKELSRITRADFTLLDVVDWNISDLPLVLFDGENIPFSDKEFDIALLLDVLHHSEKEEAVISEAMRVAKKVIVLEEVHENRFMDIWANISDNFQWILFGMPWALHHRNEKEWVAFLKRFCSKIRHEKESFGHAIFTME
ncbi:MAG: methyltransferase domain-containing protein [Candidatus Berkelbacteria bacterium]|nr:methyltransferase domain-containing protein [Candidatus Berkelbacteria bacterium]